MRKGVLYTMTLSLLSIALLSVAVLFIQHSSSAESRHIELSFTQKIIDLDSSIQNSFAEAIQLRNTTHVVVTDKSFTVYERIPTDFDALDDILANLETSINSDIALVNVSTSSYNATHAVIAQPLNITYEHETDSKIQTKQNFAITGYNITLRTTGSISGCSQSTTPGTLTFEVYGLGAGANCTVSSPGALTGSLSFIISGSTVAVLLNASGQVSIQSNTTIRSEVTTYFNEIQEKTYAEVPIIVQITDPSFYFIKESYVRVW